MSREQRNEDEKSGTELRTEEKNRTEMEKIRTEKEKRRRTDLRRRPEEDAERRACTDVEKCGYRGFSRKIRRNSVFLHKYALFRTCAKLHRGLHDGRPGEKPRGKRRHTRNGNGMPRKTAAAV